ncbi:hypothetical protein FisN_3Lh392 [Fistulifera solaris]|uniref:EamA domain-containing protein n=1 Tax=Fistulifera solaris TaxID=1519565 RepID=A0A1Z5J876_FISSO|nr:hypothetical protein FisN_3Lh392 [Fistulifera solaris]|eukprot:GAX10197.1 hypothetical protein FisN_3Lh392 [Fistulifera solaris]
MGSVFDNCNDSCGWVAGIVAAVAYGCFGVPIKETAHLDVHPLILQSYKTGTMFVCCWWVMSMGVDVSFTPWGILSGFLWVLGGTAGIYAIRLAGMAVSVGTWASVMICVNFVWGILIFREPVASIYGTMGAFGLLGCGLVGMSWNASPPQRSAERSQLIPSTSTERLKVEETTASGVVSKRRQVDKRRVELAGSGDQAATEEAHQALTRSNSYDSVQEGINKDDADDDNYDTPNPSSRVMLLGVNMTRHQAGLCGAVFNGIMSGSSLLPLHFAKKQGFGGARYMISYSTGALLSNGIIWCCFVGMKWREVSATNVPGSVAMQTYASLPSWHCKKLWLPGVTAGLLLTIAMFGTILSTTYLGQGIGNSIVQSKILISGLWGIFWYKEVSGLGKIVKWFISAALSVMGIICLSYERLHAIHKEG